MISLTPEPSEVHVEEEKPVVEEAPKIIHKVPVDPEQSGDCSACGDTFKIEFDDETDQEYFLDAILNESDSRIYHPGCLGLRKSQQFDLSESAEGLMDNLDRKRDAPENDLVTSLEPPSKKVKTEE